MIEQKQKGRPVGSPNKMTDSIKVRNAISKTVTNYFTSNLFQEDIVIGGVKNKRLQTHIELLPYTLTKKESIRSTLQGLNEVEQAELAAQIKNELK